MKTRQAFPFVIDTTGDFHALALLVPSTVRKVSVRMMTPIASEPFVVDARDHDTTGAFVEHLAAVGPVQSGTLRTVRGTP